jgi:hypothetical protein
MPDRFQDGTYGDRFRPNDYALFILIYCSVLPYFSDVVSIITEPWATRTAICPGSQPIFQGYGAILPTSLTHIDYCSTIDIKPWRPDEVYGTVTTPCKTEQRLLKVDAKDVRQ